MEDNKPMPEEDDFDSLLDDCSKDLDKKMTINEQAPKVDQENKGSQAPFDFSKMPEINEDDMVEAQKMFQEMLKSMNEPGASAEGNPDANPFLQAANQMFKDFEQMSKEPSGAQSQGADGFPGIDDPMFKNLLNTFAKDLIGGEGGQGGEGNSDKAMENLMNEFTSFLKDSENNDEMKSALESVVQEIISKDTLY